MVKLMRQRQLMRYIERVCREVEQPFTIFDLTEAMHEQAMHGQWRNYPTIGQLAVTVPRMLFVKVVGAERTRAGTINLYEYVGADE